MPGKTLSDDQQRFTRVSVLIHVDDDVDQLRMCVSMLLAVMFMIVYRKATPEGGFVT